MIIVCDLNKCVLFLLCVLFYFIIALVLEDTFFCFFFNWQNKAHEILRFTVHPKTDGKNR